MKRLFLNTFIACRVSEKVFLRYEILQNLTIVIFVAITSKEVILMSR